MKCPKCEEGMIVSIVLKMSGDQASLCNYCETLWLQGEQIKYNTGHPYDVARKDDREYTMEVSEEKDQEHRPAQFTDKK
jgi:hypothetical protein